MSDSELEDWYFAVRSPTGWDILLDDPGGGAIRVRLYGEWDYSKWPEGTIPIEPVYGRRDDWFGCFRTREELLEEGFTPCEPCQRSF